MLGREVEEFQASLTAAKVPGTFLVVGGMGHASSVALGMALSSPGLRIWCFDGDGAMLMHLGAVPVIADSKPNDFIHVVFDNGAHDSVGGQRTPLRTSSLDKIAIAAGYSYAGVASTKAEVEAELIVLLGQTGPKLLVIKIRSGSRPDLGRPKKSPEAAKAILMETF
jgi:phosphonopyruvate decarboxylase